MGKFAPSLLLLLPGIILLAATAAGDSPPRSHAAGLEARARFPQIAADSASGATATPAATVTLAPSASATPAGLAFCTVTNVVDGDTIDVSGCGDRGRIRFILVDTPEISPGECFGKEPSAYTKAKLLNHQGGLENDVSNKDRFGRNLRYIWLDGELFNERLVRDGYAALAVYPPDVKYQARIAASEQEAKTNSRGLWPVCGGVGVPGTPTPVLSATATSTPSPPPAGTATPTPTVTGSCTAASATITGLDKVLEVVTVSGARNMTGWYLISTRGSQRYDFPDNFTLSGSVQTRSGTPAFPNSSNQLWWTSTNMWDNSEDDDAVLYDCSGQQRSYFDDGD
ncbi:MAG: thermonuclease family protein [Thermoflexaceae bacterium]|nr:thermonuclease family protein [Thermoflexaceae bacterium]